MMTTSYSGVFNGVVPNANPGFISPMKEKLFAPREDDADVLPTALLAQRASVAFSALRQSLGPTVGISEIRSITNIKTVKKQYTQVGYDAMRFFASRVWTGTHQGGDFAKISSAY